ncbi:MAG: GMC family oxidoreductase [Proteobacteria bacterium]|nr:MAG: GMC family oxidoreductase [Pseudomonadota bacterium]
MLIDLYREVNLPPIATEVCIIGAGAAGLILARRLLAAGVEVAILESGGADFEADSAGLNEGSSAGHPYYPLEDSRLRFFGGTTAIWGGRVARLDAIDFERRPWIAHSGWPFGAEELADYYQQAEAQFAVAGPLPTAQALARQGLVFPEFDSAHLSLGFWKFDDKFDRFTHKNSRDLKDHPRCRILLHATVSDIVPRWNGRAIDHLVIKNLRGLTAVVRAKQFVLATGGLENPRLLLASRSVMPKGVGNDHDQVGRYFMEHPHARGGRVISNRSWRLLDLFARRHDYDGAPIAALIRPSDALQRRAQILNTSFTIGARQAPVAHQFWGMKLYNDLKHNLNPTNLGRGLWRGTKRSAVWLQKYVDPLRPWALTKLGRRELAIIVRAEQAPNPDSRVYLGAERDALGMPKLVLDWRFSDIDKRSVRVATQALDAELRRLGWGHVEMADWLNDPSIPWQTDPLISSHHIGGYHHMGTTRMHADPKHGVVDDACRVHGIANLYIAGSSVFPVSGWANPTLTIAALSLRLGDHLKSALDSDAVKVRAAALS